MNRRREKLIQRIRDKEHRDAFVSAQIDIGIPFQIRALREQNEETQAQLATRTGMAQAWISKLENPAYSGFSIATLKKIAFAFDVGLMIRFVPIGQLVEWELNLSNNSLQVPKFEDDPYFNDTSSDNGSHFSELTTGSQPRNADIIYLKNHPLFERMQPTKQLANSSQKEGTLASSQGAMQ
jgi:transcriptional regulator with XRE-family HTH domain